MQTAITPDVWVTAAPVRFLGMRLTSTMTVLRLGGGGLVVHSPVALTAEHRAAVERLGPVQHLYAPNLFHHLHLGDWMAAFPGARVHAPAGLPKKRPELRIDRPLPSGADPALADVLEEVQLDGFRLDESVVFHRASRSLIVADLLHNIGTPAHAWTAIYTRAMGFYDRAAVSRMLRWTAVSDRRALRQSLDRVLALPFERMIVGHGAPIENARAALENAWAWLD